MKKHSLAIASIVLIVLIFAGIFTNYLYKTERLSNSKPLQQFFTEDQANQVLKEKSFIFQENQGQTDEQVKFLVRLSDTSLFFTNTSIVYALKEGALQQVFLNASHNVDVVGEDPLGQKTNYFIGNDPSKWQSNVTNYQSITYINLYDQIDLKIFGDDSSIHFTYHLENITDLNLIEWEFEGATDTSIHPDGTLVIVTDFGNQALPPPKGYQEFNNQTVEKQVSYRRLSPTRVGILLKEPIEDDTAFTLEI